MQGKVIDGQYQTEGFINAMNKPVFKEIPFTLQDPFWWPLQWDLGHWTFVRTALKHSLFSHGKMYSVASETAKELKLQFRTSVPFAKQHFMSSSSNQMI